MNKIIFYVLIFFSAFPLHAEIYPVKYFVLAENKTSGVDIIDPWARVSSKGARNGSIYMKIKSAKDDKLLKAEARNCAQKVEVHTHVVDDKGIAHMTQVPYLACKAGLQTTLKPMGDHIMLLGLKQQLKVGQQINLTLHFENAGKIHVTVPVIQTKAGGCKSCKA